MLHVLEEVPLERDGKINAYLHSTDVHAVQHGGVAIGANVEHHVIRFFVLVYNMEIKKSVGAEFVRQISRFPTY